MSLIASRDRIIRPRIGDFLETFSSYGVWKAGCIPHNEAWMRFMRERGYPSGWTSQDMSDMTHGRTSIRDVLKGMFDKAFEDMLRTEAGDIKDILMESVKFASEPRPKDYTSSNEVRRRLWDMSLSCGSTRTPAGIYYHMMLGNKAMIPLGRILTDSFKRTNNDYWPALVREIEYIVLAGQGTDYYNGGSPKIVKWPDGGCIVDMSVWARMPNIISLDPRMRGKSLAWIWNVRFNVKEIESWG